MRAKQICREFGELFDAVQREFNDSNATGAQMMIRADSQGNGLGQYLNAERLFYSWLYEMHRVAHCDSVQSARNEWQD